MRILLVADSLDVGGAERHVVGVATALVGGDHEVEIACSVEGGLAAAVREVGVTVHPLGARLVKRRVSLGFARHLRGLLDCHAFDVVHAHMFASAVASMLALHGRQTPLVITEHSEASWRDERARSCSRLVYARAARVIAVSRGIRRRLIELDGVPPARVAVIPNALAPSSMPGSAVDRASLAPRGGPVVGAVARMQTEKGLAYFLEMAELVLRRIPQASFVVLGDGPQRAELEALVQRLGIAARVRFLGFRPDASAVMRALDVLVVPSLSEGTPLVVLEAMTAGVPLVATAVGGIPEQVRHGRDAVLVPPADAGALAAAVVDLLNDPPQARRLADAARCRMAVCGSHDTMMEQTLAIYSAALATLASDRRP